VSNPVYLPPQTPAQPLRDQLGAWQRLGTPLPQRPADVPSFDNNDSGPVIVIDTGDKGGVQINTTDGGGAEITGFPAIHGTRTQDQSQDFGENLAGLFDGADLARLGMDTKEGVDSDVTSRQGWIEQYKRGIDLLGNKIEDPPAQGAAGNRRGISKIGHPLLMEAIIKYESSAEGELLPAAGPAKVTTIGTAPPDEEQRASDLADDLNYYLTEIATEFYPDTENMLTNQGYCGLGYKKGYRCPIRRRPVSESVLAPDLIVSEEATDLQSAQRVTHSIQMTKSQLKRMQIFGDYLDIDLGQPTGTFSISREAQRAMNAAQGISPMTMRPQDQPYDIWECDREVDIDEYGINGYFERQSPDGLPLHYKVTIDSQNGQVLGVWRNWRQNDSQYLKRNMYVKYGLVPSGMFHSWGFLHLLGNQTRALRACWRLLIDAGMFANFPGGVKFKNVRTSTNEIAPGPGEFVDIDVNAMGPNPDIAKLFMPLPYKGPDATFVQFIEIIKQDAMRLGATVQLEVGEGRTNVPVGTVLAMIEQQIQVMAAVHKRNHRAQKEELRMLRDLFAEHPEDLNRLCRDRPTDPGRQRRIWQKAEEFTDLNLVPASDPNVPSKTHAIMMANVLLMLATMPQNQGLYDLVEANRTALTAIGADPNRFLARQQPAGPAPAPPPDPAAMAKMAAIQQKQQEAVLDAQTEAAKLQLKREELAGELQQAAASNQTRTVIEQEKTQGDIAQTALQHQHDRDQAGQQQAHEMNRQAADHQHQLTQQAAKVGEQHPEPSPLGELI
jgi:hypothetical protein